MDTLARMVPFTREVYLGVFEHYNDAIWPAQIVAYLLCLIALWRITRPFPGSGRLIAGVLGLAWIWTGVAYHMLFFSRIDWAAWAFGLFFVVQGILFLVNGTIRGRLAFHFTGDFDSWAGVILIAAAMLLYPLVGDISWSRDAFVGIAPCPTTLFTFGMLLLAEPRTPWYLLVIPVLWSLIGGSAALVLGIPQDAALPVAALLTIVLAIWKNRLNAAATGGYP
jgi:Family of unknown function (DUF6064)